jgi:hypothetical protein
MATTKGPAVTPLFTSPPVDALKMFLCAEGFLAVADKLREGLLASGRSTVEDHIVAPFVVNGAFALEVYFKCLIFLETNNRVRGHDLDKLFGMLTPAHQNAIDTYSRDIAPKDAAHQSAQANRPELATTVGCLKYSADAYEHYRYIYEPPEADPVTGLPVLYGFVCWQIIWATRRFILELRPDWDRLAAVNAQPTSPRPKTP